MSRTLSDTFQWNTEDGRGYFCPSFIKYILSTYIWTRLAGDDEVNKQDMIPGFNGACNLVEETDTHPNNYLVLGIKEIFLMTKETFNLGLDGLVRVSQRDRATAFLVFVRPWWRIKLVMFKELQEGLLCAEQGKENSKILSDVYLKCNPQKSQKQGNE